MGDLKAGDVAQLKSGGPRMTIKWIEDGEAYCEWFAGTEKKADKFSLVQLQTPGRAAVASVIRR